VLAARDPLTAAILVDQGQRAWPPDRLPRLTALRVGGPLYPPVNAFLLYPLALLPPHIAYRTDQVLGILLGFVAALAVRQLAGRRIWWPVAAALVITFPGFAGSVNLGQNAALTLNILVWGWVLIAAGRPGLGGIVWGLLVFKPVWALAFFLVPLLSRRWRVCVGMAGTGLGLALLTLPVVGLHSWREWIQVGGEATQVYKYDQNWIQLSRDLLSIPRRWMDFAAPWTDRRDNATSLWVGWPLLLTPLAVTMLVAVLRTKQIRDVAGPGAAFLLLGAWMSCFHFMYYDVLLAVLPVALLFTDPWRYVKPLLVAIVPLADGRWGDDLHAYFRPRLAREYPNFLPFVQPGHGSVWVLNRVEPTLLLVLLATMYVFPLFGLGLRSLPYDTFCLMLLWAWCGWLTLRMRDRVSLPGADEGPGREPLPAADHPAQEVELGPDVGGPHEGFANQHRPHAGRL
jgi:hypothetical protein